MRSSSSLRIVPVTADCYANAARTAALQSSASSAPLSPSARPHSSSSNFITASAHLNHAPMRRAYVHGQFDHTLTSTHRRPSTAASEHLPAIDEVEENNDEDADDEPHNMNDAHHDEPMSAYDRLHRSISFVSRLLDVSNIDADEHDDEVSHSTQPDDADLGLPVELVRILVELGDWMELRLVWSPPDSANATAERMLAALCEDADVILRRMEDAEKDEMERFAEARAECETTMMRQRMLNNLLLSLTVSDGSHENMIVCIIRLSCQLSGSVAPLYQSLLSLLQSTPHGDSLPLMMMVVMMRVSSTSPHELSLQVQIQTAAYEFCTRRESMYVRIDALASLLPVVRDDALRLSIFTSLMADFNLADDATTIIRCIWTIVANQWEVSSASMAHSFTHRLIQLLSHGDPSVHEAALDAFADVWFRREASDADQPIFADFIHELMTSSIVHADTDASIRVLVEECVSLVLNEHGYEWHNDVMCVTFLAHIMVVTPMRDKLFLFAISTLHIYLAESSGTPSAQRIESHLLSLKVVPMLVAHLPAIIDDDEFDAIAEVNHIVVFMLGRLMDAEEPTVPKYGAELHQWMRPILDNGRGLLNRMEELIDNPNPGLHNLVHTLLYSLLREHVYANSSSFNVRDIVHRSFERSTPYHRNRHAMDKSEYTRPKQPMWTLVEAHDMTSHRCECERTE